MTTSWRVLGPDHGTAAPLLRTGVDLLESMAGDPRPTLRWYRATHTAIVLGRGQGSLTLQPTPGVEVHQRHSGGGAVLLDPHLLNLDVVVPAGHDWLADDDLGAVFLRVGAVWARALDQLGVPHLRVHQGPATARRRGTPREQLLAAVCYATLGRGEVVVDDAGRAPDPGHTPPAGRKLVGLSQRRRRPGALVQCGLLERWSPAQLLVALGGDPEDAQVHAAAVGLHDLLAAPPADAAVRRSVETAFATAG